MHVKLPGITTGPTQTVLMVADSALTVLPIFDCVAACDGFDPVTKNLHDILLTSCVDTGSFEMPSCSFLR